MIVGKMTYEIIIYPHPLLRQKAKRVKTPISPQLLNLAHEMIKIMQKNQGIGLAAPQVGEGKRLIVAAFQNDPLILFNPEITKKSFKKEGSEEGCLSLPNIFGIVKRHRQITLQALSQAGSKININAEGLLARVIQHEIDHLDGILFIDKAEKYTKGEKSA